MTDPGPRLDQLFRAQAARTPDAIAIVHRGGATRYAELDRRSNRIARHLAAGGIGPGDVVAICLDRSPDLVAAILAVLKTGAAYLPLDPAYPLARNDHMVRDSRARALVTRGPMIDASCHPRQVCDLDRDAALIAAAPATAPEQRGDAGDPAYVIYTSGSSGVPKGVILAHTATALVAWARQAFPDGEAARIAATTSICFDPSIIEIFVPLCSGGTMILKENALDRFDPDDRPTMLGAPPSVVATMLVAGTIPPSVRVVNVGGETVPAALVDALYAQTGVEAVYNHYGPTEATTCTTVAYLPPGLTAAPPIGTPICGARVYVLDAARDLVPDGAEGELYIAGPTVAIGYVGGVDRDDPRFIADPFVPGERMYRTGDLGLRRDDGQLVFRGRLDDQVKIRGHRVEVAEVEAALRELPGVSAAAVVPRVAAGDRIELVAYLVAAQPMAIGDVRRALGSVLPAQFLPGQCVTLDALPLTPSGKIDRAALPEAPAAGAASLPGSPTEEAVSDAFRDHLGLAAVGGDDDFYDLGGDSLLAVSLALDLEARLGVEVPPSLLTHYPTPRALAEIIDSEPVSIARPVTPLQAGGDATPLFCAPDILGHALSFASVARHLAPSQPVYGLSPGPAAARIIERPSMAVLVADLADAIRAFRPNGPYRIAGYSFGTSIAHALACALEASGEEVALVLIDGPQTAHRPRSRRLLGWAAHQVRRTWSRHGAIETARRIYRTRHRWARWSRLGASTRVLGVREVPPFVPPPRHTLARALMEAQAGFEPGRFGGPARIIRCREPDAVTALHDTDGMLGWRPHLRDGTAVVEVPGGHFDIMRDPNAASVADAIAAFLASA